MRIATLLLTPVLISGSAVAQSQPANDATPPPLKPGKVEGTVLSSVGGTPVKKATVTLRNLQQHFAYAATSDATGHFVVENVQPGTYQVTADSSGFMAAPVRPSAVKPITVAEEQEVKDVAVKLTPLGSVTGHVLDADGEPIARAYVTAEHYVYQQGRKRLQSPRASSTNDLGEFQLLDLQPGRYYLRASAQARIPRLPPHTRSAVHETAYVSTFYPSGSDVTQAKSTQVDAGSHIADIDFRLTEVPAYHIRGKVPDGQTGQTMRNSFIFARPAGDGDVGFTTSGAQLDPDGSFDIRGLVDGSYKLGFPSARGSRIFGEPVTISGRDLESIVVQLPVDRNVSGSVTVEGTPPDSWRGMRINLSPVEEIGGFPDTVVDRDGAFSIPDVPSSVYALNIIFNIPGKYVKSIRFGDHEITDGMLDLRNQADGKLEILIGSDVGELIGGVQTSSGDPAPGALITLTPKQEGRPDLFKVAGVDQNGNFTLMDVAPGEYMAFAWQDVDVNMAQSPDFRKPFESKGVSVSIAPSGQVSIQLKMISAEEVEAEKSKLP